MGYNIGIGNARPYHSKQDGELYSKWVVDTINLPEAPTFLHDEMTGNGNWRYPSYGGWSDFCNAAGIWPLFYSKEDGLMREHPGCFLINKHHLLQVQAALEKRKATSTLPPGFWGEQVFDTAKEQWVEPPDANTSDPILARLIWLEFWMRWALANCETPAIENS